jgi:hypothetical protein
MKAKELRIGNWVLSPTEGEVQIENGWQIDEGEEVEPNTTNGGVVAEVWV